MSQSKWKVIDENTPRDGTPILLCDDNAMECFIAVYWEYLPINIDYNWTALDQSYHKDWGTHWMPIDEQPMC